MRKYPQLALAWTLFWLGHIASKVLEAVEREWWADFWYPVYNWLMLRSNELDEWEVIWVSRPKK